MWHLQNKQGGTQKSPPVKVPHCNSNLAKVWLPVARRRHQELSSFNNNKVQNSKCSRRVILTRTAVNHLQGKALGQQLHLFLNNLQRNQSTVTRVRQKVAYIVPQGWRPEGGLLHHKATVETEVVLMLQLVLVLGAIQVSQANKKCRSQRSLRYQIFKTEKVCLCPRARASKGSNQIPKSRVKVVKQLVRRVSLLHRSHQVVNTLALLLAQARTTLQKVSLVLFSKRQEAQGQKCQIVFNITWIVKSMGQYQKGQCKPHMQMLTFKKILTPP